MSTTVAHLTARTLLGRRRAPVLALLPAALLALAVTARALGGADGEIGLAILDAFALGTVVPLVGLIVGTGAIGPEIDDGSILYVLVKPLSRHRIARSKVAVAVAVVVLATALPTWVAGTVLTGRADGVALRYAVAAAVAGTCYAALFLLLAVVTRNAVVVGLLYALLWESLIGGFVPGAQALSVRQWALAVAEAVVPGPEVAAAVGLGTAIPLLLLTAVGGTWLAGHRLRSLRLADDG